MEKKRGIPIGQDDFLEVRRLNAYYVDKSLLIKEIIDSSSSVLVFTRPRRFGKSLNISMLGYYFDRLEAKAAFAFEGLKISDEGAEYKEYQNNFPVIKMTLKDAESANFENAFVALKEIVAKEYKRHAYLLESDKLTEHERSVFQKVLEEKASFEELKSSLGNLASYLYLHFDKKVIILIDEYDVPLEKSYFNGYYEEMVGFIRSFFSRALKSNNALHQAIITGCLRVSKESIFTGVNNLNIISILSNRYDEYFGFTENEVQEMLAYFELTGNFSEAKIWYNGYQFGRTTVYNPWSMINYIENRSVGNLPRPYWSNTSSNEIIKTLIRTAASTVQSEIEQLIQGHSLKKFIHEDVVYSEIEKNMDNLWSFLLFTGYLKKVSEKLVGGNIEIELKIPNQEVNYIFERQIKEWFEEVYVPSSNFETLYDAIRHGDAPTLEVELTKHLRRTISYMDSHENFYHGAVAGILMGMPGYSIQSNRESGKGRSDLFIKDVDYGNRALIFELKTAKTFADLEASSQEALNQIEEKQYEEQLLLDGYMDIEKYGIAFFKKRCRVKKG